MDVESNPPQNYPYQKDACDRLLMVGLEIHGKQSPHIWYKLYDITNVMCYSSSVEK